MLEYSLMVVEKLFVIQVCLIKQLKYNPFVKTKEKKKKKGKENR